MRKLILVTLVATLITLATLTAFHYQPDVQAQSANDPVLTANVGIGPALQSNCRPNGGKFPLFLLTITSGSNKPGIYRCVSSAPVIQVPNTLSAAGALNFPSTSAQSSSDLTITVTGAALNDVVHVGVPNASVLANSSFSAWVSATNTVTVRFNNYSSGAQDPASGTFRVVVSQF